METQLQERDLYQGYESTYDSQYIPNAGNPHLSGGVFTINIPANEAKSLSFDHMALLGRFRVISPTDLTAVTNYHMLDPMLLCYLKSLTINGQPIIFQPQEHDGRLRCWLKYDIGKNARNTKYPNYSKVTAGSTGPVDVLNKRGA
ncbi:hypothetical protein N9188_00070 [bacterium]|nr:hypothetical protein [bacterium]